MDYRDERDALRAQKEALEQELAAARADAEGKERLEKELAAKEKELVRLRNAVGPKRSPGFRIVIGSVAGVLAIAAMAAGAIIFLKSSGRSLGTEPVAVSAPPVTPSAVATKESPSEASATAPQGPLRFTYESGGLAALEKDVGGSDGVVAITFVDEGQLRAYCAVAFAGEPLTERWRIGPYLHPLRVWTAKSRALVFEQTDVAHLIDTKKGVEFASVSRLSDAPSRVCIREQQAWITAVDEQSIGVNLETGAGSVGARLLAPVCGTLPGKKEPACSTISAPFCGGDAPSLPGFALKVAGEDGAAVALGAKSPGTPEVLAAGFDPKTATVRWRSPIAGDDDAEPLGAYPPIVAALDGDLFVAVERLRSGASKLRGFDAKTGERRFVYAFPTTESHVIQSVVLGADRIYATRWGKLYVIDRATGKELARLGS